MRNKGKKEALCRNKIISNYPPRHLPSELHLIAGFFSSGTGMSNKLVCIHAVSSGSVKQTKKRTTHICLYMQSVVNDTSVTDLGSGKLTSSSMPFERYPQKHLIPHLRPVLSQEEKQANRQLPGCLLIHQTPGI